MPSDAPQFDALELDVLGEITDEHIEALAELLCDLAEEGARA